jgi:serine/threonine protein kinase HipA of HipAB toxin-antitoxin module
MTRGWAFAGLAAAALTLCACGGDDSDDGSQDRPPRGEALGSGSKSELLGRARLAGDPGRVAWIAHEVDPDKPFAPPAEF